MELPFVDSHCVTVSAPSDVVWAQVVRDVPRMFQGEAKTAFARILGCRDMRRSTGPLAEGASIVGFHVARTSPNQVLELVGQHRFSRYSLTFRLSSLRGNTSLCADTHAEFPGLHGALYRTLVIRSRAHVVVVRGMLRHLKQRAEMQQNERGT